MPEREEAPRPRRPLHGTGGTPPPYACCGAATRIGGCRMPKPENNVLMRDAQDWLRELRGLQAQALARRDFVQAEEVRAEVAEVTACLDGVLESAQGA